MDERQGHLSEIFGKAAAMPLSMKHLSTNPMTGDTQSKIQGMGELVKDKDCKLHMYGRRCAICQKGDVSR